MSHQAVLEKLAIEIGSLKVNEIILELELEKQKAANEEMANALNALQDKHIEVIEQRDLLNTQVKELLAASGVKVSPTIRRRSRGG